MLMRPVVALRRKRVEDNDLTAPPKVAYGGLSMIIKAERHLPVAKRDRVSLVVDATVV